MLKQQLDYIKILYGYGRKTQSNLIENNNHSAELKGDNSDVRQISPNGLSSWSCQQMACGGVKY